jgi:hypothetical protein
MGAAHAASSPTYYACLKGGTLTKVGVKAPKCNKRAGYKLISWNQMPTGAGFLVRGPEVVSPAVAVVPDTTVTYRAACPAGSYAISGGYSINGFSGNRPNAGDVVAVLESRQNTIGVVSNWEVTAMVSPDSPPVSLTMTVYAECVTPT